MTSLRSKHRANLCCGIFFLVFSGAVALYTRTIPISSLNFGGMNSRTFPYACCAIMGVLSLCLIYQSIRGLKNSPEPTEEEKQAEKAERKKPLRALCAMVLVAAYTQLVKPLGYLITTPLFLFGLFMLATPAGVRRPVKQAIVAIVVTVCVYLVFHYAFAVQFPMGPLKFLA